MKPSLKSKGSGIKKIEKKVFFMALDDLPLTPDKTVPSFIPVVRDFINKRSANEGIFRKCGNFNLIQELGVVFAAPSCAVPPSSTVFEVAGFLKQWLNSLPEPLITPSVVSAYLLPNTTDPKSAVETLKHLNPLNRRTVAYIFSIMKAILNDSDKNKMHFGNVQSCFITSLTQNQKGRYTPYPFPLLYRVGTQLLNDAETDFILDKNKVDQLLSNPLPQLPPPCPPLNSMPNRIPAPSGAPVSPIAQVPARQAPRGSSSVQPKGSQVKDNSDDDVQIPKGRSSRRASSKAMRYSMPLGGVGIYQEQE